MAKKYNMLNYGKKYKQMFIDLMQDTTTSIRIPDEITWIGKDRWAYDTNLTYIDFNRVEIVPNETCRECSNLTQAVFSTHTTQIGDYAFYNCTKFEDTELPHTLTNIGQYAFYQAGSAYSSGTHTFTMIDEVGVHTTIGQYAFYDSHLSEISTYTNDIGGYAFQDCFSLTDVNLEIHGALGFGAFYNCLYVENFIINPNSVITGLDSQAFYRLASSTSAASRNIAPFDFRNSTFTSLSSNIWYNNQYNGTIYLPSTLTSISGNFLNGATGNWKLYFNSAPTVSSSSYLRNDSGNFTVKYFFPYDLLSQVSVATNWSSHTSQMVGYGTGFEVGSTLPEYVRSSGVAITWYSDETMTTQITTSSSATDTYYCTISASRVCWFVDSIVTQDCTINITDGTNVYTLNDPVPVNTSLRITATPTDPTKNIPYAVYVNNINCKTDFINDGYVDVTMNQDLQIFINYWNGTDMPLDPVLSNNSWSAIQWASENNQVPPTWNVGDTKTYTYNGNTYEARLVDKTGKFLRVSNGSPAYLLFETVDAVYARRYSVNRTTKSSSPVSYLNNEYFSYFDKELTSVLEPVIVPIYDNFDDSNITSLETKIFFARWADLSLVRSPYNPKDPAGIVRDEYYQTRDTNTDRRKKYNGSYLGWFTMSWSNSGFISGPYSEGSQGVCGYTLYDWGWVPRFAL